MTFLTPFAALVAAAITVPALVALYFLKLRRRQVEVSTTLLWRKAIQDLQVNAPFQRLRRNLLLLLQLLILAALLLALARPVFQQMAAPGRRMILVIDRSASMNATDVASTRLEEARRLALELIDSAAGLTGGSGRDDDASGGGAMVVAFGGRAHVAQPFTSDRARLRAAVRAIEPTDEPSDLAAALALVEPWTAQAAAASEPVVVYVLSDGRVRASPDPSSAASLAGAEVRFLQIGRAAPSVADGDGAEAPQNVAIVSLAARRDLKRPEQLQVFAALANYAPRRIETDVTLRLDGRSQRVASVAIPPAAPGGAAGEASVQFDLDLPGAGLVEVSHSHVDHLAADNSAALVVSEPQRLRVLLVTPGNEFLQKALRAIGVRRLAVMAPAVFERQRPERLTRAGWPGSDYADGFDALVFDRYSPGVVPGVDSLYFAAAPPIAGLELVPPREGEGGTRVVLEWARHHPLMRYVALDNLVLHEPARLVIPPTAEVLATAEHGPVMAVAAVEGVQHVVAAFDVLRSNWPADMSFPVFMSNAVPWLAMGGQPEAGASYRPGEVAAVPVRGSPSAVAYRGPAELRATVSQGVAVLPPFPRVGVYHASPPEPVERGYERLAVSLLDAHESDIRAAPQLRLGGATVQGQAGEEAVRREVWWWFAWAALAVLMVEWIVYTRRMHL